MTELISIIVTTYERPDALETVLRSLARQTDRNFEVVIADDGSGPATAAAIDRWKPLLGVPLKHVWQENRGFRAAAIRNKAILAGAGGYCIFLDGDCIAPVEFVAAHRALAEPNWFVTGNRILLSAALTSEVLQQGLEPEYWRFKDWTRRRLRGDINRLAPLLRLPLGPFRKMRSRTWTGARSCNLAVWRFDLDRVDGFDARYRGWGREDSDLLVRLLHAGVRRKDGVFATGVLHLWHPQADRSALVENDEKLKQSLDGDRVRSLTGLRAAASSPVDGNGGVRQAMGQRHH